MKKLIYLLLGVFVFSCSSKKSTSISGEVEGIEGETTIIISRMDYKDQKNIPLDSIKLDKNNNTFSSKVEQDTPDFLLIEVVSKTGMKEADVIFVAPNENISLKITLGGARLNIVCEGSVNNDAYKSFTQKFDLIQEEYTKDFQEFSKAKEEGDTKKEEEILTVLNRHREKIKNLPFAFYKENKDSYLVPWVYLTCTQLNLEVINFDELSEIVSNMSEGVKNSFFAKILINFSSINNGGVAPEFTLKNELNKDVSLKDFKGKLTLIAFWVQWDEEMYKRLHTTLDKIKKENPEIEIISIFLGTEQEKTNWTEIIKATDYNFTNLIGSDKIATSYFINGRNPFSTILVGKDGKIISKDLFGKELKNKIKESL